MKRTAKISIPLLITIVFLLLGFTRINEETSVPSKKFENIEANYLAGINSGNEGLKINSAYFLGEIKSRRAVIPLMDIFRNDKNDGSKLVAAWSLLKIGDSRGIFLIKRSIDLGENEEINLMLQTFYKDYVMNSGK